MGGRGGGWHGPTNLFTPLQGNAGEGRGCRTDLTNESVLEEIKERHNVLREQMKC